jgi:hypothetical protein
MNVACSMKDQYLCGCQYLIHMAMNERTKRGFLLVAIGLVLVLAHYIGRLDQAFLMGGAVFALLGFGDIFYDKRYRRRF